jgi:hypothetical protein
MRLFGYLFDFSAQKFSTIDKPFELPDLLIAIKHKEEYILNRDAPNSQFAVIVTKHTL